MGGDVGQGDTRDGGRGDHPRARGHSVTKQMPQLIAGQILTGPLFNEPMRVETVQSNGTGSWIVGLVGMNSERFRKVTMTVEDLPRLTILDPKHSFNGDGRLLRLGLQAYALGIAYEFDPYFGLSIRCLISSRQSTITCSSWRACGSCWPMTLARARQSCRAFSFASWSFAASPSAS